MSQVFNRRAGGAVFQPIENELLTESSETLLTESGEPLLVDE